MSRKTYNKLVRDRIPERLLKVGAQSHTRVLDNASYGHALHEKLEEEAKELHRASTSDEVLEELADVLEVVNAIAAHHGFAEDVVRAAQQQKRQERGGFVERIFLEYVDEADTELADGNA